MSQCSIYPKYKLVIKSMIHTNLHKQLGTDAYQHFQAYSSPVPAQNNPERTPIKHSQIQGGIHRNFVSEVPSNSTSSHISHQKITPQKTVNVIGSVAQQITTHRSEIRAAYQVVQSNTGNSTQFVLQSSRRGTEQSVREREQQSLEEENLRLKSTIERMRIERDDLVRTHDIYMKNDEAARVQIFGEVQKLQNAVQKASKQLQQSKQRQLMVSRQFEAFRSQHANQSGEAQRNANTINLIEKLKAALEGRQTEVESLKQTIQHLGSSLSNAEKIRQEQASKLKFLQSDILQLQQENQSIKEYQSRQHHQMNYRLNEIQSLKAQIAELQKRNEGYAREKEVASTHVDQRWTEKGVEVSKVKSALQNAEASNLTMQYLSKEIHNYRLIIEDLQAHKQNGYRKDIEITKLHNTLTEKEKSIIYLENDNDTLKAKLATTQNQHRLTQEQHKNKIRDLEQECTSLKRKIQLTEIEKARLVQSSSAKNDIQIVQLTAALDHSRNEFFSLRRTSDEKIFELQTTKIDFEVQVQSMAQAIEKKEAERLFIESQYKTLHSQFLESKRQASGFQLLHEEIRVLKEQLFQSRQQNNRLEIELRRMDTDQSRTGFHTGGDFSKILESQHHKKYREQQHHRQAQSMGSLREQNENLKHLLQNARMKLEEYSNDFEECQQRMSSFQERMQNLLAGGNPRLINNQESIYEQKQKMDEVVHELKAKLKLFKKENQQLKKKVRQSKEDRRSSRKRRSKDQQQPNIRQHEQYLPQRRENEQLLNQLKSSLEMREGEIKKLASQNQQLTQQISQAQQVNAQNQADLKLYTESISQYEKTIAQYEGRIKQYQSHMLKLKQKYKQQAYSRLPEPEVERPSSPMQNVSERLEFFKAKSQESEQRVKQLLKINNELKAQVEQASYLIGGQSVHTRKIQLLEEVIVSLQKKLVDATQENFQLKAQVDSAGSNPNISSILELKIRQLMQENSQLKIQISQASNQIVALKQAGQSSPQQSSSDELSKLEHLERKFQEFNRLIYALEEEKAQLQNENAELKARMSRQNTQDSSLLLEQISRLQQETYQLRILNRQLQIKSSGVEGGVGIGAYNALMFEVGKIMKLIDSLHITFANIVDVVGEVGNPSVKMSIEGMVSEVAQLLRDIDMIRQSVGGMRQQFETATAIHQMQQLI